MSLAMTEKRSQQQRVGGCAGIFFQLLDWNGRLAKKKLFSRRLLPPVRAAKRASKKLGDRGGDDKMPMAKLLLIADENRGSFPKTKKSNDDDPGDGMRAPGLVARLMGLESMPVVTREKPRKALGSGLENRRDNADSESRRPDQDLCQYIGGLCNLESRPQKLLKTGGFLERRPTSAARAGHDVFGKRLLPPRWSRKREHELASPVKSPGLLSRSHRARLVQAATRIFEPGLQSKNRAKCAITYMGSSQADTEEVSDASLSLKRSNDSLLGSCSSCGSFVEVSELTLREKEPQENEYGSSTLDFSNASSSHESSLEGKTKLSFIERGQSRTTSLAVQAKVNVQNKSHDFVERKKHIANGQDPRKPQKDGSLGSTPKKNNFRQNRPTPVREKVAPGFKVCSRGQSRRDPNELNGSKNFVALNRNESNHSRTRSASKVPNNHQMEMHRNGQERNMAHKRTINTSHIESMGAVGSTFGKPRSVGSYMIERKVTVPSSNRTVSWNCVEGELQKDGDHIFGGRNDDAVSFMFNSTMKHATRPGSHGEMVGKSRGQGELSHDKNLELDPRGRNSMPQRRTALQGHGLTNLLEEKIRELASLVPDELGKRDARFTASILEELISALTGGAPISEENDGNCFGGFSKTDDMDSPYSDLPYFPISQSVMHIDNKDFQEDAKTAISSAYMAGDNDKPSPISILEAYFSNDSCSFGSQNGSSGVKLHFDMTESCNTTMSLDQDIDLLDSATSVDVTRSINEKIPHSTYRSFTKISEVKFPESKLSNASETILNADLLFENFCLYNSDGLAESSVKSFLIDLLETIMDAFVTEPKSCSVSKEADERNRLNEYIFDCIIECLDLKCSRFCKSGYKMWSELHLFLSRDRLRREIQDEIKWWMGLTGNFLDDLIKKEINHSTGKWMDCEIEAFETGMEVERDILQALVDEMVIDLCRC